MKSLPLVACQGHGGTFGFLRNVRAESVRSKRRRLRRIRATRNWLLNWDGAGTGKPAFCTVQDQEIVKNQTLTILDMDRLKEEAEVSC